MKLLLGCAAYRSVSPTTAACMIETLLAASTLGLGIEIAGYAVVHGYGACRNLEGIAQAAIDAQADALLYHDADMVWTLDDVEALVALHARIEQDPSLGGTPNHHVVAAQYPSSSDPNTIVGAAMVARTGLPDGHPELVRETWAAHPAGGRVRAVEADRTGFGFILIPTRVFRGTSKPWFEEAWDGREMMTPDTLFGDRVRGGGGTLWLTHAAGGVRHEVTTLRGA